MSSEKVFGDRRAFGKTSVPPATMAMVNAASGQRVFKPSHCSTMPMPVNNPDVPTRHEASETWPPLDGVSSIWTLTPLLLIASINLALCVDPS